MKFESGKEKPSMTGPFWTVEGYRIVDTHVSKSVFLLNEYTHSHLGQNRRKTGEGSRI